MAEERRRKTWSEANDYASFKEYYDATAPKGDGDNGAWSRDIVCKTCKYAAKRYNGTTIRLNTKNSPYYAAGTCEQYETKPSKVYFDGDKCPKYEAK